MAEIKVTIPEIMTELELKRDEMIPDTKKAEENIKSGRVERRLSCIIVLPDYIDNIILSENYRHVNLMLFYKSARKSSATSRRVSGVTRPSEIRSKNLKAVLSHEVRSATSASSK